jgi:SAM-dependent methyltransferase
VSEEHLEQVSRVYSPRHYGLNAELDESLDPRGPELLLDVAGEYLTAESLILDIGCRDAKYLIRLVQGHGCRGVGIDPVEWHVEQARAAVDEVSLAERIEIVPGVMERIEQPGDHFDLIWSRDMLVLVEDLEGGLRETARVLKPDGVVLLYTNVATPLLAPHEAALIGAPLGNVERNFDEEVVEGAFDAAGLVVDRKHVIGTEWREYEEERDRPVSRNLLRLARLRRKRAQIVEQYGEELYRLAESSLHWLAFQLLGKLRPTLYVLRCR